MSLKLVLPLTRVNVLLSTSCDEVINICMFVVHSAAETVKYSTLQIVNILRQYLLLGIYILVE